MTKNFKKFTGGNFFIFIFISKIARRMNDAKATGEAFSPQNSTGTSSTSKHEHSLLFYFCGSLLSSWIRIHIKNVDLDPTT
jgi:hypothetical protein